ncbi:hypothetical protein LNTAR_19567 [Lentisphaera araneosa HTCC2155]|uniref:Dienelactone hydrolase domain-containing protein n=1 Tax=Lentisphaera araneosa HTCC2155 TaxID=313628 RepID=A6DQX9_9BACT|nr:prolyl oligopeptidase family serine peptidase [Lentisphaera araneosa]EDM26029.1 hypothetical protein LNTAR_19567 [Lentisphaera araneosa HTCC2155]
MKFKNIIVIFGVCLLSLTLTADKKSSKKKFKLDPQVEKLYENLSVDSMPYRLLRPLNFDDNKKYPVIISLHGAGERGKDNKKQLKAWPAQLTEDIIRKDFPCYVVAPQSNSHWEIDRFEKVKNVIQELPAVDKERIYIMGHSMGGHGTFLWIQHDPKYFAAAAPCAGSGRKGREFVKPELIKDLPLWVLHGDKDNIVPYEMSKKLLITMKKLNGNMKLTTWLGAKHGVAQKIIPGDKSAITEMASDRCDPEPDFLTWMFKQSR